MSPVNPYRSRERCPDCPHGERVIYNVGYPAEYAEHTVRLCERHYRAALEAARTFDLSLSARS